MRFITTFAVIALLGAGSVASAQSTQAFSRSAVLGTTRLRIETTVTPLAVSNDSIQRFRLRGTMTITIAGSTAYSVNPWFSIGAGADANGIADGFSAIDITDARLAYLSGEPQPDAILYWMGCGANCTQASTFLSYDARRRTYVVAPWVHQPDWDTVGYGKIVHLGAMHEAIATMQPTPFDDCHACLPGTVPVYYAISGERVIEISGRFPAALRADATAAWRAFEHVPNGQDDAPTDRDVALFRYLADDCRVGACVPAWQRVEEALPGSVTSVSCGAFKRTTVSSAKIASCSRARRTKSPSSVTIG